MVFGVSYEKRIQKAAEYIREKIGEPLPKIGLILGSGLGELADRIEDAITLEYSKIPKFPVSTVEGHSGRLVFGKLCGRQVVAMQGRFHYYEGYDMKDVTLPVRVMKLLGVETLIVTNAAGAVNISFSPGELMLISDHINLTFESPLRGKNMDDYGVRFPDMTNAYDESLRGIVKSLAAENGIKLNEGVYACMGGPAYETPAEIRMLRVLGADAVGMSTVPEVICAVHSGMRVIGISCVTNMGAGILKQPLDHSEVMRTSEMARESFVSLLSMTIERL
ncbi:MAG: purine-nucleoside phosphorylase [Peptoclostridium sp.]|nr:purine-nucleoside phosphorylase [Peptoclostridium sp.]